MFIDFNNRIIIKSLYDYLIDINKEYLLDYWDVDLNELSPKELLEDYKDKIHWKCEKGHRWQLNIEKAIKSTSFCKRCYWDSIKKNKEKKENEINKYTNENIERYRRYQTK